VGICPFPGKPPVALLPGCGKGASILLCLTRAVKGSEEPPSRQSPQVLRALPSGSATDGFHDSRGPPTLLVSQPALRHGCQPSGALAPSRTAPQILIVPESQELYSMSMTPHRRGLPRNPAGRIIVEFSFVRTGLETSTYSVRKGVFRIVVGNDTAYPTSTYSLKFDLNPEPRSGAASLDAQRSIRSPGGLL
jgi:hypothetical protein